MAASSGSPPGQKAAQGGSLPTWIKPESPHDTRLAQCLWPEGPTGAPPTASRQDGLPFLGTPGLRRPSPGEPGRGLELENRSCPSGSAGRFTGAPCQPRRQRHAVNVRLAGPRAAPKPEAAAAAAAWDTFNRTRGLRQKRQSDRGAAGGHPAHGTPGASQPEGEDDKRAPHGHSRDGGHSRYRSTNHTSSGKGNCSDDRSLSTRPPAHQTHGSPNGRAHTARLQNAPSEG